MAKVIGVRFRTAGKIYFFDPLQFEIKRGDHVIVETARGIEYGTVMSEAREIAEDKVVQPLKPVIRIANERDAAQEQSNREKEREAFKICFDKIREHGLDMKLIDAEYTFDNNKVLFYFTADGRIDFRELVKDLASVFKTRIELRQIGVRDETKLLGGIGICGRPLCCHSYLADFVPVSIKMAKEQNLSLNPTKISGVCGRLMCCLKNEEETYEELNRRLPNVGDTVTAEDGTKGEVQSVNVLRQRVRVVVEEGDTKEIKEYEVGELHFKRKHTKKERMELSPEELAELERLEKEEIEEIKEMKEGRDGATEEKGETAPRSERQGRQREKRGGERDNHGRDRSGNRDERSGEHGEGRGDNRERRENRRENRDGGRERRENRRDNRGENREGNKDRNERRDENRRENRRENKAAQGEHSGNRDTERRFRRDRRSGRKVESGESNRTEGE